jgi:galactose oxidase
MLVFCESAPPDTTMLPSMWTDDRFFASPGGKTFTATWDPYLQDILETNVTNTYQFISPPGIQSEPS